MAGNSTLKCSSDFASLSCTVESEDEKRQAQHIPTCSKTLHDDNRMEEKGLGHVMKVEVGSIVTLDIDLVPENNYVPEPLFDTKGKISFVVGWGNYLPGIHDLVLIGGSSSLSSPSPCAMRVGEEKRNVGIDAGWGQRNKDLVVTVQRNHKNLSPRLKKIMRDKEIVVGMQISLAPKVSAEVIEVSDDHFVLDANPRLAGASYSANVKVLSIEHPPEMKLLQLRIKDKHKQSQNTSKKTEPARPGSHCSRYQVASFGLGCFWGGELAFMRTAGVVGTKVGYTQGHVVHPSYEDVCTGKTRHTEAIWVIYDPEVVTYKELLTVAMERSKNDNHGFGIGTLFEDDEDNEDLQYSHVIFYHTLQQKQMAREFLENNHNHSIGITEATIFYEAEEHHQQYLLKGDRKSVV